MDNTKLDNLKVSRGVLGDEEPIQHSSAPDGQTKVKPDLVTDQKPVTEKPVLVEDVPATNPPVEDALPTQERAKEVEEKHKEQEASEKEKRASDEEELKSQIDNKLKK